MRQMTIGVLYDTAKIDALRQFSPPDKPDVEAEILALVDRLFEKRVPLPVRQFIENRAPEAGMTENATKKARGKRPEGESD